MCVSVCCSCLIICQAGKCVTLFSDSQTLKADSQMEQKKCIHQLCTSVQKKIKADGEEML